LAWVRHTRIDPTAFQDIKNEFEETEAIIKGIALLTGDFLAQEKQD